MNATEKQIAFITRLATERQTMIDTSTLSKSSASQTIEMLLASPRVQTTTRTTTVLVTETGMYRDAAGDIFKVQESKTSGKLYAKALTPIRGQRLNENDASVAWEFVYAPSAIKTLRADERLSLDDARAFGIQYGVCCVCGRTLKDATSVANGIGPICAGNL